MEEQAQVTAMADLKRGAKESGFVKHLFIWYRFMYIPIPHGLVPSLRFFFRVCLGLQLN